MIVVMVVNVVNRIVVVWRFCFCAWFSCRHPRHGVFALCRSFKRTCALKLFLYRGRLLIWSCVFQFREVICCGSLQIASCAGFILWYGRFAVCCCVVFFVFWDSTCIFFNWIWMVIVVVVVDVGKVVVVVNLVLIVVDILSNIRLLFDCAVFRFQSFL